MLGVGSARREGDCSRIVVGFCFEREIKERRFEVGAATAAHYRGIFHREVG